jgi:polyisoprenoid-binding protein YceI
VLPREVALTPENTVVSFAVRWFGVITVRGRFGALRGTITVPAADGGLAGACVRATVEPGSVRTGIALRDRHLRGRDFFAAAEHPTSAFESDGVAFDAERLALTLDGRLTVRGRTHPVRLACTLAPAPADASGTRAALVHGACTVPRRAFAVGAPAGWRRFDPLFAVIADLVRIEVTVRIPLGKEEGEFVRARSAPAR